MAAVALLGKRVQELEDQTQRDGRAMALALSQLNPAAGAPSMAQTKAGRRDSRGLIVYAGPGVLSGTGASHDRVEPEQGSDGTYHSNLPSADR
jgi:hypothetical protein